MTEDIQKREPVSAFVICFNEEEQIEACLDSLSFCDEVLVIDSFSTDRTVELATKKGATVIQRKWPGYRDQKVFGLASVKHKWVVNLDADERVTPELRDSILRVLSNPELSQSKIVGYQINRVVYYLGRWWRRGGWYPEYRVRFFRKDKAAWGGREVHEKLLIDGETGRLKGEIEHYTYKNMVEQFAQLHNFSTLSARAEFEEGRRASLISLVLNPCLRFIKFYFLKKGFLEGMAGFVVAAVEGCYTFMKYAKLWELGFSADLRKKDMRERDMREKDLCSGVEQRRAEGQGICNPKQ